jgi:hypothetical protein
MKNSRTCTEECPNLGQISRTCGENISVRALNGTRTFVEGDPYAR